MVTYDQVLYKEQNKQLINKLFAMNRLQTRIHPVPKTNGRSRPLTEKLTFRIEI
jgi:lauroyl/myristoyl acyltransferase